DGEPILSPENGRIAIVVHPHLFASAHYPYTGTSLYAPRWVLDKSIASAQLAAGRIEPYESRWRRCKPEESVKQRRCRVRQRDQGRTASTSRAVISPAAPRRPPPIAGSRVRTGLGGSLAETSANCQA